MRTARCVAALALLAVGTGAAFGQYPLGAVGFNVSTNLGQFIGSPCWWSGCTPATGTVAIGEVVTIRINGEWNAPYLLGVSLSATSCVTVPGVLHELVLDAPISLVSSGTLSFISPILACPNGFTTLTATVPPGIPSGTKFAIQALTHGAGNALAFTGAIVLTIG